ncbi:hypothetical protein ACQ3G7_18610 [Kosakonia oryzendophytica]|uniref:hypothetical protein n=1 Tax=Kosakonia oryzendophytica TaxID=1005665 RepID=UPI003D327E31
MNESLGYMDYDFSSLRKSDVIEREHAREIFMKYFEIKKGYKLKGLFEFNQLDSVLSDNHYLVMNNDPRRKGKRIFFTGNVVEAAKMDLLDFLRGPIEKYDLIIPLIIVPVTENILPEYIITTQEDPLFEFMVPR